MKKLLASACLLTALLSALPAFAAPLPAIFHGFTWGRQLTDINQARRLIPKLEAQPSPGQESVYTFCRLPKDSIFLLGEGPLSPDYLFLDGQFAQLYSIVTSQDTNPFDSLSAYAQEHYGAPIASRTPEGDAPAVAHYWQDEATRLEILYRDQHNAAIVITSLDLENKLLVRRQNIDKLIAPAWGATVAELTAKGLDLTPSALPALPENTLYLSGKAEKPLLDRNFQTFGYYFQEGKLTKLSSDTPEEKATSDKLREQLIKRLGAPDIHTGNDYVWFGAKTVAVLWQDARALLLTAHNYDNKLPLGMFAD